MPTRSERHPKLLRLIVLGDGTADAESLASALQVSTKTVRRDIAALRQLGFAIEPRHTAQGRKTYWLAQEALANVKFTYDEAFALMLCRDGGRVFAGTPIGDAAENGFEKVSVALGPVERSYLDRMMPRVRRHTVGGDYSAHGPVVDALTLGIEDSKATFITYRSARSTEPVTYDIHPYGMVEHRGTLYVVGYSCHHEAIRTWKVDRMLSAEVTEFPFRRPPDFDLDAHFRGAFAIVTGDKAVRVRVRFTGTAARYVQEKRMHPSQSVTLDDEGTAEVTFELTSTLEIRSWILSFGPAAEVLEPQALREEIRQDLRTALAHYAPFDPADSRSECPIPSPRRNRDARTVDP